jgi:hypothetical protein
MPAELHGTDGAMYQWNNIEKKATEAVEAYQATIGNVSLTLLQM